MKIVTNLTGQPILLPIEGTKTIRNKRRYEGTILDGGLTIELEDLEAEQCEGIENLLIEDPSEDEE